MRYLIAAFAASLALIAAVLIGGGGHGWIEGAFGCFVLAPICFLATENALRSRPSTAFAIGLIASGLLVACNIHL